MDAFILNIVMLVGVIVVFAVIHPLIRHLPFDRIVPRERFRWPVWNWYAITVATALVVTLSWNLYLHKAIPTQMDLRTMPSMFSYDGGQPINNAFSQHHDADAIRDSEIQPVRGEDANATPDAAGDAEPVASPVP